MGTITAKQIIDGAAAALQDAGNDIWDRLELLAFVNDGQRDACLLKADAYVQSKAVPLVAGTTQRIPADGTQFVRLVCNMGPTGDKPGRAPRAVALALLDSQNPNWHFAPASNVVLEYGLDPADPKRFYVSPPQPVANPGYGQLVYNAVPPDLAGEASPIALDDVYKTALEHYLIYRAYLKEGEQSSVAMAATHRAEFMALLGVKQAQEQQGGQ